MSVSHPHPTLAPPRAGLAAVLPVYAGAIFLSAALLFSVQPMFTKMVLPLLGSSPSVWTVAMVFFQASLLAGYAYAHAANRWLSFPQSVALHLIVLSVAFLWLPFGVSAAFGAPPSEGAAWWLIALFTASIGLPFFACSANAPLLQAWFSRTGHSQAADPYFLYGASNLGSFLALLSYPLVLEPLLDLRQQSGVWTAGFALLIAAIAAAGALGVAARRGGAAQPQAIVRARNPVTWRQRATWTALAFVPSALLLAVTAHISTDLAAAPFLWIVPLTLFLLTFVLTFRSGGDALHAWMVRLQPILVAPLVVGAFIGDKSFWMVAILLDLGVFFVSAMICHRGLHARRPDASQLTEFYMWISVGGVLGGMACGLLAPAIFPDIWEYPILIVLALLCRPGMWQQPWPVWRRELLIVAAAAGLIAVPALVLGVEIPPSGELGWKLVLVGMAALIMLHAEMPARFVGLVALTLFAASIYQPGTRAQETSRSFFGVHKVSESYDGRFRLLYHGTTIHGAQRLKNADGSAPAGKPEPLTYYYFGGPLSEAIAKTREARGALANVAVVGLGTGSLNCHARDGEGWRFYEIDPEVVRIAEDPEKFRFMSDCNPSREVVLGDARLTLANAEPTLDLLVLDAFSSDVVPVHLLTKEAIALYLSKLGPRGAIAFHISNRYLELATVVADAAAANGLVTMVKQDTSVTPERFVATMHANAMVAVVARSDADIAPLADVPGWSRVASDPTRRVWTDDYSNILGAIWRKQFLR